MKKITLLILAIISTLLASAQITINNLNINLGDLLILENDTITTLNIGTTRIDKNWDFSFLKSHEKDSILMQEPTLQMKGGDFTDADLAILDDHDSTVIFLDKTSAHLKVIGFVELDNSGDTNVLDWKMPFITFPSSIGTIASEETEFGAYQDTLFLDPDGAGPHPFVDSFRITQTLTINTEIDAEGIIEMPKGDFPSLRQMRYEIVKSKVWMYANNNWVIMSDTLLSLFGLDSVSLDTSNYEVRFWTNDPAAKFSLIAFKLDSVTRSINNERVEWLDIAPSTPNGLAVENKIINNIYPIPTQNQVVVTLKNIEGDFDYQVLAITGEILSTGKLSQQFNQISTSDLSSGTYLLKVNSSSSSEVIKIIKK